jgi:hypothetical protein
MWRPWLSKVHRNLFFYLYIQYEIQAYQRPKSRVPLARTRGRSDGNNRSYFMLMRKENLQMEHFWRATVRTEAAARTQHCESFVYPFVKIETGASSSSLWIYKQIWTGNWPQWVIKKSSFSVDGKSFWLVSRTDFSQQKTWRLQEQ